MMIQGYERTATNSYLGQFEEIYSGHASDDSIWLGAGSGGMVTALLLQLLEEGKIDATTVLDFSENKPWQPELKITSNPSEIVQASQSKYFIYPQNMLLKKIKDSLFSQIAYTGLPCQIHGLRKAMARKVPGIEKIKYLIGLYCGNNLYYQATLDLISKLRYKNINTISRMAYRDGDYPGKFVIESTKGKTAEVDKFTFNYLSFLYVPFRCLYCIDLANEFADISFGDGWRSDYQETKSKGQSVVIVRSSSLLSTIKSGKEKGNFELKKITLEEALRMHSNVLDNKKVGAFVRMDVVSKKGGSIPDYNIPYPPYSLRRSIFERFNLAVLRLGSRRFPRLLIKKWVPLFLLKKLMVVLRGKWREKTRKSFE